MATSLAGTGSARDRRVLHLPQRGAGGGLTSASELCWEQEALFRKQMRITVTGDEVPSPVGTFEELHFSADQRCLPRPPTAAPSSCLSVILQGVPTVPP